MHIHPSSSLPLASLAIGREETLEARAKRAAEIKRKLASHAAGDWELPGGGVDRVGPRTYEAEQRQGEDESFGRLFSAKA